MICFGREDFIMREFVFDHRTAPTPSCHASTLVVLKDGTILTAWFGGTREGSRDVKIWSSRRENGVWSRPVCVSDEPGVHWNPVLFELNGGIGLFYKLSEGQIDNWHTRFRFSTDGGRSWTPSRDLVPGEIGGRGPVKNKPLRLSDGSILAPASHEDLPDPPAWKAFADRSEDEGASWNASAYFESDADLIQPSFWEPEPGKVHALLRSNKGYAYRVDSEDFGRTWSPAYPTKMPNNNSGLDLTYAKGSLWLVCNPISGNWASRSRLVLFRSTDNGEHFERYLRLEGDPSKEYSYPAVVYADGALHITYTWRRERVAYIRVEI